MWPDWSGETVAIIASGPSAKNSGVHLLKGKMRVIAIKKSFEIAPFADVVYGCDGPWWRSVQGLKDFKGLRLSYDRSVCTDFGIQQVTIPNAKSDDLLFEKVGTVGAAGNSGFQALNLALQFGAKRILLVGFDMHGRGGEHWYGRNNWNAANNPTTDNYRRWVRCFENAAPKISDMGAEVINTSPFSDLKRFKKMTIEQSLNYWRLNEAA